MNEQTIQDMFEKLKNKELNEYFVNKADFLTVRMILVKREDFKHFRGTALRGGDVVYQYMDEQRS
ncbi:hypothetical protein [Bacillus sp. T3]|uniref:hypothetical protein n=1 Tax=Bacillus sp. T3 TaxID=467262 RepID=UPI002981F005|nr:hypothetical protein [Bacillus sp. T3]